VVVSVERQPSAPDKTTFNRVQHTVQRRPNQLILKPDYPNAHGIQIFGSRRIVLVARYGEVARAVQFHRKLFLRAVEIKNKLADAVLTAEFAAVELIAF
jgi:hypothetical protein